MKVVQLNYSDSVGGAARAAYRVHHALRASDVDSEFWVASAETDDWTVLGPSSSFAVLRSKVRSSLGGLPRRLLRTENTILHSSAMLHSRRRRDLNSCGADVLHLHWINGEFLSISDIGKLRRPLVWTLHDMWPFCGAEHYTEDMRWRDGYSRSNRPSHESGFDLNRWTWGRKRKHWREPIHIVTPSNWLADCVRESALMRQWPVSVIPNAINTHEWQPIQKNIACRLLGVPHDVPLLLFGAAGGTIDPRKGFDLLLAALCRMRQEMKDLQLVVFGQRRPRHPPDLGFPIHYLGHLYDDISLRVAYSAATALVIPSRQDNLPNTGVEALTCGTPVVAFDSCGLRDIVVHGENGYLAKPFDVDDLANGLISVLSQGVGPEIRSRCRGYAESRFSSAIVAEQYKCVYRAALA